MSDDLVKSARLLEIERLKRMSAAELRNLKMCVECIEADMKSGSYDTGEATKAISDLVSIIRLNARITALKEVGDT